MKWVFFSFFVLSDGEDTVIFVKIFAGKIHLLQRTLKGGLFGEILIPAGIRRFEYEVENVFTAGLTWMLQVVS